MLQYLMKAGLGAAAVSLLLFGSPSNAAQTLGLSLPPVPVELTNKQQRLTRYLQPSARAWIDQEAQRLANAKTLDEEGLRSDIRARFTRGLNGGDIDSVAFSVLMRATADMDGDLKDLMAEIKNLTTAKGKLRDLISKVGPDVVAHAGKVDIQPCTSSVCQRYPSMSYEAATALKQVPNGGTLRAGTIATVGDLRTTLKSLTTKLDSMNDIREETRHRKKQRLL